MKLLKTLIKKHFTGFTFFYRYLGSKIFLAFVLSVAVSFLDGLGLSMFFPLLQVVGGENSIASSNDLGNLAFIVKGLEASGISLTLISVLGFMIVFFSLKGIAKYAQEVYLIALRQKFIRDIRLKSLALLNNISFKQFIGSDVGRIQNTMTGETDRVSQAFQAYFMAFQQGIMVAVYMGFAFFLDAEFALLVCVGGLLSNFLYKQLYTRTKDASRKLTGNSSAFQGEIIQHIANFKYLKASGRVNSYGEKLKNSIHDIEESRLKIGILNSISTAAREPLLVAIVAAVIFVQVRYFDGAMGPILISLLFFYRALTSMMQMQQQWNKYMEFSGSLDNLKDFQETLGKQQERQGKQKIEQFQQAITLEQACFAYGNHKVLNNINLSIAKNQSIAFVGESGSGKTTLVSLLAGLLPPTQGQVQIDGININELDKESYQQRIGYVSQDPVIFNDTIFNNITFWAEKTAANIERFEQVLAQASLTEFVLSLAEQAETKLGNNGINLSGGQKQRISIARELFKEIDILVLDEATSALDSETERTIQESIEALQGQYTLIMIAHRFSTIRNADVVVLLDKGELVDKGSFTELQERQERFKKMVELQEI